MAKPLTRDDIMKELASFELETADIAGLMKDFEYQGFDPITVLGVVMTKPDWANHVKTLLVWYLARGASTKVKPLGKTKTAGVDKLRVAMNALGVISGKPVNSGDITVARLVACFPHVVMVAIAAHPEARVLGDPKEIPRHLAFPSAPSLLTAEQWAEHQEAWLEWALTFDRTIRPVPADYKKVEGEKDIYSRDGRMEVVKRYAKITFESKLFSEKARLRFTKEADKYVKTGKSINRIETI